MDAPVCPSRSPRTRCMLETRMASYNLMRHFQQNYVYELWLTCYRTTASEEPQEKYDQLPSYADVPQPRWTSKEEMSSLEDIDVVGCLYLMTRY